jgi:hypothetical protein
MKEREKENAERRRISTYRGWFEQELVLTTNHRTPTIPRPAFII